MAYSKILICNMALAHFGGGNISSLTEDSEQARLVETLYDNCLEQTFASFQWSFANVEQALASSVTTRNSWNYVYAYPANCARMIRVYAAGCAREAKKEPFKIFTTGAVKLIACDIEDAIGEFTYIITDPTLFSPGFVKAFSYYLAAELVTAMTGNAQKAQEMMQKFQLSLADAQYTDAVENNEQPKWPTSYVDGRR